MAVYLYKPPTWRNPVPMEKGSALVVGVTTSTTVYRLNGTWYNVQSPGNDDPDLTLVDVEPRTGLLMYFNKPTVVPEELHDELLAVAPADSSWTEGSLTQL